MNNNPIPKKKKNISIPSTYKQPPSTIKSFKQGVPSIITTKSEVQEVFPVSIDPTQLTPQLKQYIYDMEKQYLQLQSTLMSNREKYQELFGGLAAILDQRGVASEDMIKFFNKAVYYPPESD